MRDVALIVVWVGQQRHAFTHAADNPALFWIPATVAAILAVVFSIIAYDLHFRLRLLLPVIRGPAILIWLPFILPGIGILLFLLACAIYALQR